MEFNSNPLKQYFRRPAVYMKLPSGGQFYDAQTIDMPETGELAVYPMTAIDDITVKTPDALFNGQAVADVIKSCVPSIKNPWRINTVDLDALLLAIKSASAVEGITVETTCPSCNGVADYNLNLPAVLNTIQSPDYSVPLLMGELSIFFRPLEYKEINEINIFQFDVQRKFNSINSIPDGMERDKKSTEILKDITELTIDTLARSIRLIGLPSNVEVAEKTYIIEYLRGCDKKTFETIRDHAAKLKEDASIKPMKIKCIHCQHEYEQTVSINMSDFFG